MESSQRQAVTSLSPMVEAPTVPTAAEELDLPSAVVDNLVLKHLSAFPKSNILELSQMMGIATHLLEESLALLRKKSMVEVFQPSNESIFSEAAKSHIRYALSEFGTHEADSAFKRDAYLGPIPVSLAQYQSMVEAQDLRINLVTRNDVERALSDVYGAGELASVLGPAINSGRALLLYGHAGTGKSYVANRILNALNTSVYVPYAVYAFGNVIKVYSEQHHRIVDDEHKNQQVHFSDRYDKRWVLCERPNIQVGGELTMDMLEVNHNQHNRVWMAPLQMMANNGIFVIDDLGRQAMAVDSILNRWIVPMEYQFDHLSLPNGQQITVPFILTLAFSTNLEPKTIADPAFLRRLGYKIQFEALDKELYDSLWREVANKANIDFGGECVESLHHLHKMNRVEYFPCIPKDIVGICKDIISFEQTKPYIDALILERAWELYFTAD